MSRSRCCPRLPLSRKAEVPRQPSKPGKGELARLPERLGSRQLRDTAVLPLQQRGHPADEGCGRDDGAHPVPGRSAAELFGNADGCDGTGGKAAVDPLEVERKSGEHGEREQGRKNEERAGAAANEPAERRGNGSQRESRNLERPEEPLEEVGVLAVPAEKGLWRERSPERHQDRSFSEQGSHGLARSRVWRLAGAGRRRTPQAAA